MIETPVSQDLWALFGVIIFGVAHLGLSSILSLRQLGPQYILSARDERREAVGIPGRVARAYRNLLESFAQFAAALFLVHAADGVGELSAVGAWMFFVGRVAYLAAYAFGTPGMRPICWMFAQIGIILILVDLFR